MGIHIDDDGGDDGKRMDLSGFFYLYRCLCLSCLCLSFSLSFLGVHNEHDVFLEVMEVSR